MRTFNQYYFLLLCLLVFACKEDKPKKDSPPVILKPSYETPSFDADSAYYYVAKQVAFGPRVPGTPEHKTTSIWLKQKLESFVDETQIQTGSSTMYNGKTIPIYNIIGSFNPETKERILLAAHWDSRHVADKDVDPSAKEKPIDGANDGASGVGVLLEIARQLRATNTDLGVDIIFFDAEDLGTPVGYPEPDSDTWCLGSDYWGRNPHVADYNAKYGILLDMVGASDAIFKYEMQSYRRFNGVAPLYIKTWNMAHNFGYNDKFIKASGGSITDDHIKVMEHRGFPMIDIIDFDNSKPNGGFGHYHHTQQDNMDVISKSTLRAVGETVLGVLKYEN